MQIKTDSITGSKVIFENILEDVPGGVALNVTRLDYSATGKEYLAAGTPVYVDVAARTAEVCKTAKAAAGSGATTLYFATGHHFKVSDSITDFVNCRIISAITASGDVDAVAVPSGLITASGTVYAQAYPGAASGYEAASAAQAALYTPNGLTKADVYIKNGNADVAVVKMGTAREVNLPPLPSAFKVALRGGTAGTGTSLITLV